MDAADIPLPCGYGVLWPTMLFSTLCRLIFLPLPHKFLTALFHRLRWLAVRIGGRATVSRTNGLVKSIADVWLLCGC